MVMMIMTMMLTTELFFSLRTTAYDRLFYIPWKSPKPTSLTSRRLRGLLQPESTASPVSTPDSDASQILKPLPSLLGASVAGAS